MTASCDGVAKLGFGAMRLPLTDPDDVTAIDIEQLKAMVDEFIAKGGTYVDTAFVYHDGASETALREALVERYPRNAYTLATKCLAWACASKEEAQACLPTSLERLGVDYIDYYLLHNLGGARTVKFDEYDMWNYVAKAKADGLVRHVGFSMHDGPEALEEILTAHPEVCSLLRCDFKVSEEHCFSLMLFFMYRDSFFAAFQMNLYHTALRHRILFS